MGMDAIGFPSPLGRLADVKGGGVVLNGEVGGDWPPMDANGFAGALGRLGGEKGVGGEVVAGGVGDD